MFSTAPAVSAQFIENTTVFNAKPKYERRVLLCLLGETPAVITETLSLLLKEGIKTAGQLHAFRPTELRIITTGDGADNLHRTVAFEHWLNACLKAWGYTKEHKLDVRLQLIRLTAGGPADRPIQRVLAKSALYTMTDVNLIGDSSHNIAASTTGLDRKRLAPESIGDVRNSKETQDTANYLLEQVDELVKDGNCAIHASIAGGRKSMGALLTQIMSLLGREQDTISHVLTHKKFEASYGKVENQAEKEKWLKVQPWLAPSDLNSLDGSAEDKIFELSMLDFVRLAPVHKSPRLVGESYSYLVRRINARLHGQINFSYRQDNPLICDSVDVADYSLNLTPGSRALLLWLVCQTGMQHKFDVKTEIEKLRNSWREALKTCNANAIDKSVNAITNSAKWGHMLEEKTNQLHKELDSAGFPEILKIEMNGVTIQNKTRVWEKPDIYLRKIDKSRFNLNCVDQALYK
jgi:CRISPR-associated protein (TIGR02584 family)